ncbi:MAG: DUF3822 family protein [Bacteroidales bacterium]|nr:DUF3822 family protein [Bacteroidales bacterium]
MSYKSILLSDESFHQTFVSSYKAIILIEQHLFACTFLDTTRKKFIYFFAQQSPISYSTNELERFLQQNYLTHNDLQKFVIYATSNIQCIPESFNVQSELQNFNIIFDESQAQILKANSLSNIVFLYKPAPEFHNTFMNLSNTYFYPHVHSLLLQTNFNLSRTKSKNIIAIHFFETYFEVIVFIDKQIMLINTFLYSTVEDILYYIHAILNSFTIKPDEATLFFSGNIQKHDIFLKNCKQFNLNYHLTNLNQSYIYSYRFNELSSFHYSTIFFLPYENY